MLCVTQKAVSQSGELHGQASAWLTADHQSSSGLQSGLRYIPDFLLDEPLSNNLHFDMELSLNSVVAARFAGNESAAYDTRVKPYRGWLRISTDRFEARAGLQKINFGSATLFRPLMWFDRIDPRDPLQLTDGVYGLLGRYTFQNNANIWLWGLYGNNDTKGWELVPTEKNSFEFGGRVQSPFLSGETGLSFHHRGLDAGTAMPGGAPGNRTEDRYGLDGKWDAGVGLWFEGVLVSQSQNIGGHFYQRMLTLGTDYTFGIGNGLTATMEFFRSDNPASPLAAGEGTDFSGLSATYPLGIVDQVGAILYRDWKNKEWYRFLNWHRTYDNWILYVLAYWNPDTIGLYQGQSGGNAFAGKGIQLMVVFNH